MTSDSAISVIMLKVKPTTYMKKKVAMTEVGSASAEISVERQSRMKTKMTSTAIKPPKMMLTADVADVRLDEVGVVVDRADRAGRETAAAIRASARVDPVA